jgi:O-antigen ligase
MVAVAVAVAVVAALVTGSVGVDHWVLPRRIARVMAAVAVGALLVLGGALGPSLASRAWHQFKSPRITASADPAARLRSLSGQRYQLWSVALKAFDRHPATGTGAGTYEFWWNRNATLTEFVRNAHSLWIESLAELGLPGLMLLVVGAAAGAWVAVSARIRSRTSASVAVCVAFLAALGVYLVEASVDWMWQSTAVTALATAGVAACSLRISRGRRRLGWVPRAAIALACGAAGLVQVPGLLSTAAIHQSQAAERRGDQSAALAWADHAVGAEPWAASPYLQRGLVLEANARLAAAAADLRRATTREPTDYVHWLILARVEAEQGSFAQATRDERRGRSLRPASAVFAAAGQ